MGGEPLLHPQIVKIFDITRRILPQTFICLHTNGILLTKMPDEFWEACRKNKIAFKITKYPVMKNFSEVVDLCLRNEIRIETLINGNEFLHWMDRSGNGQIEENFHACKSKFGCCYISQELKTLYLPDSLLYGLLQPLFQHGTPGRNRHRHYLFLSRRNFELSENAAFLLSLLPKRKQAETKTMETFAKKN